MDPKKRIDELRARLEELSYAYYVLDELRASDAEYDELFRELEKLERDHPEFDDETSPTRKVGAAPLESFRAVPHREPMLSLANALDEDDIREFDRRIRKDLGLDEDAPEVRYTIEPKVDGIGISLSYDKGRLVLALTRGDGSSGEDVTPNVRTIRSIPLKLRNNLHATPDFIEVRGEVYTEKDRFEAFNATRTESEGRYANPRNFTGGSLRQLSSEVTAQRPLDAVFYSVGGYEGEAVISQSDLLDHFRNWGLKVADPWVHQVVGADEIIARHRELEEKRDEVPYEIDGSVVKVDDIELRRILGARTRTPRWAVACKFRARQASTRLLDIEVSVGRTGALTPVAVLEPVALGGVTVSSASLHNLDEIRRLDLQIGDRVIIERAGDVIPKVIKTLVGERSGDVRPFEMPESCPACGAKPEKPDDEVVVRCPNRACPAQLKGTLQHLASKDALDIEGLGEKLVDQLVDRELVRGPADLFLLDEETLAGLERMGPISARNLITALEAARHTTFARLLYGLGIRHVGEHVADVVAARVQDPRALLEQSEEDLVAIHEVGEKAARSIVEFFSIPENQQTLEGLLAAGLEFAPPERRASRGVLAGKTVVITGTLEGVSRKEAENLVKKHGGKPVGSVSKATDFLLCGEKAGSKLTKAEKLGVQILDLKAFRVLIGES